jgi:hypothetical protein
MRKVAIIGGGAAGLFCSIFLKEMLQEDVEVILLEKQDRIGKKILVTGNGKCNLSNRNMDVYYYNTPSIAHAIRHFTPELCVSTFRKWGLLIREDEEGRLYPYSEKASSVLDVFLRKIDELGIKVVTFDASHIKKCAHFLVYSKAYQLENVDVVVLATGGMVGVTRYEGYQLAQDLGHTCTPLFPTLVALKTKESLKALSGLRMKVALSVIKEQRELWKGQGEVLFKDEGLSGILALDASRYWRDSTSLSLDLVPDFRDETLRTFIQAEDEGKRLAGILPKMLALDVLKRYKQDPLHDLIYHLHHFLLHPTETYGYQNAQVTRGGIPMNEVNPVSFESLLTNNFYLIGEVLDVDGACGGYNLHFAWASAYAACIDIAHKIKGEIK